MDHNRNTGYVKNMIDRKIERTFFVIMFCFAAFLPWAVVSYAADQTSAPGKNARVKLQLKWRHQFQFAGYYAAVAKGYYREAGLEVEIVEASSDKPPAEAVISGQAEFGIAGSDLLLLRAVGKPVVALAAIYQHSPMVFMTTESSGIKNIHQLAGKKVMLEPHSAELLAYLNAEGIQLADLQVLPHNFGVNDLMAGRADAISAYLSDEPFNLKENGIPYSLFFPQSSGIDFYADVLFTNEDQLTNYPERVKAFIEATQKGWKYALKNSEEIVDLILREYSQRHSREHLLFEAEKSRPLIMPEVVEVGYMSLGRWKHIAEKYRELGMLNHEVDLDLFVYGPEARHDSMVRQAIKLGEIFFALVALGFAIKIIRSFTTLEELDRKNRQINRKLEKSRRRFSLLLSNMPGMAFECVFDDHWTMLFVSKGAFELTGYRAESFIKNREIDYVSIIHVDDREMVNKEVSEAFKHKKPFKISYRIKSAEGLEKWVWEQGQFTGTLFGGLPVMEGFITDVSETKSNEKIHQQLIADLKQALCENRVLLGILPICSSCKQIRDEKGDWSHLESYLREHTNTEFSHGFCPVCAKKLFPGTYSESDNAAPGNDKDIRP